MEHKYLRHIGHNVGKEICFAYPEFRIAVARTMLALLKIRKVDGYKDKSLHLLTELEKICQETLIYTVLVQTKKAASIFNEMSVEEAKLVEKYFERLLNEVQPDETLKQCMSRELKLQPKILFDPDNFYIDNNKTHMVALAMLNSNDLEDFELCLPKPIANARIYKIIDTYFAQKGYTKDGKFFIKNNQTIWVTVTDWSESIMISVSQLPTKS